MRSALLALLAPAVLASGAAADPFTPGNIVACVNGKHLYELTLDGDVVQTFAIPGGDARDLAVDDQGRAHVYNGGFDPVLSTLDPVTGEWTSRDFPGWNSAGNLSYGGIATYADYVFVTDMDAGPPEFKPQGVVRFDLSGGETIRFAEDLDAVDLNIGGDGLLYVLSPGGIGGGRVLDVIDPISMERLKTIELWNLPDFYDERSVAANEAGEVFLVDWDGLIRRLDADCEQIDSQNVTEIFYSSLIDVDVRSDGLIVIGEGFGHVLLTDASLEEFAFFQVGVGIVFVHPIDPCTADANGDGALDILDFVAFQQLFLAGDPRADCDADGVLNILDFVCFQLAFVEGC